MSDQSVATLIVSLIIAVAIFLVCREIILWYFKLNQITKSLSAIEAALLRQEQRELAQSGGLSPSPAPVEVQSRPAAPVEDLLLRGFGKNSSRK